MDDEKGGRLCPNPNSSPPPSPYPYIYPSKRTEMEEKCLHVLTLLPLDVVISICRFSTFPSTCHNRKIDNSISFLKVTLKLKIHYLHLNVNLIFRGHPREEMRVSSASQRDVDYPPGEGVSSSKLPQLFLKKFSLNTIKVPNAPLIRAIGKRGVGD